METLSSVLPIVIYFLLIILIIIVIIVGIKLITTMNKIEQVVDQINDKVQSLNGLFNIIDFATDKISSISDTVVNFLSDKIGRLFRRRKKEEIEEYE